MNWRRGSTHFCPKANALRARQQEDEDERVLAALRADLDPDADPERDARECIAAVEEAFAEMDAGARPGVV